MAEINITTVREMIDSSFYEDDTNTVNFKMIQNVLYILARQLRILQRHVSLEHAKRLHQLRAEIKVTEIKVHSKMTKDKQETQGSPEGRNGKRGGGSPENKGSKGRQGAQEGPGDQGGKGGPGEKGSKGGKGGQGSKGGQGGKGGQGAQGTTERKEDKGGPGTSESKGGQGAKGRQDTPQDQGGQENQGAERRLGSPDSKKKQGGQTQDEDASEEGGKQSKDSKTSDKSATKSSKGKATDPSVTDDATTSKAATGKSQGKSGDRKGGKKGDDDEDVLQEKLLVVSRTSSRDGGRGTVATLDQFRNMVTQIRELQAKFGLEDTLDNEALRGALHKETSLSHPIAAVNMSSRLEAAEKKLAAIMPVVTDLAKKTPGIDMDAAYDDIFLKLSKTSKTGVAGSDEALLRAATAQGPTLTKEESDEESLEMDAPDANFALLDPSIKGVTRGELNEGLEEIYDAVIKNITGASKSNYNAADGAMKRTQRVDARLDQAMKIGDTFTKLNTSVEEYTDKINNLDGRLTMQMTNYQDELMQMQHNLESGLDTMAEVLAAPTEDAAAIAELNGYFSSFQLDIERTLERQQEMRNLQMEYSASLDELKHKIKDLQKRKSTRDEVADALSDKAGIAALNGLVTMEQYQAVRGDFEKRIGHAYDKFNNKELTWQKAIDDLVRELNEKTDLNQLIYLNKEVQKHLMSMREYLDDILNLVGDIDAITTTRKVERNGNCLSCGTPFDAKTEDGHLESRPPVIGAESPAAKENLTKKYQGKCYPGYPVTHPIDPRSLICHHYCGATGPGDRESAFKMQIREMNPNHGTKTGTDRNANLTDEHKKPCMPCNVPHVTPGSPPDSVRFNILVSGPIETLSDNEMKHMKEE